MQGHPAEDGWEEGEAKPQPRPRLTVLPGEQPAGDESLDTLDDGWVLDGEAPAARSPEREVSARSEEAVPVEVHDDDGWTVAHEACAEPEVESRRRRLTSNAEEEAFFAEGDSLAERQETDTFDDLAEDRGSFWRRVARWWRGGRRGAG